MKAVNVLIDADGVEDAALVNVLGEGQLHEDAMDLGVGVVGLHNLIDRGRGGEWGIQDENDILHRITKIYPSHREVNVFSFC